MSFLQVLEQLPHHKTPLVQKFERLLDPACELEAMAATAQSLTRQHFGHTMRLFAPLYISNECINTCTYCGFSRNNPILRSTLTSQQVDQEARHLFQEGFRNILLVAGEHPKLIPLNLLTDSIRQLHTYIPSISIEVAPMETDEYTKIVAAGAEGLVVYQETYNPTTYAELHTAGPKKDFAWRLACPDRGAEAGFRRIGIGCLIGLHDWREDILALAAHAEYLLKHHWQTLLTISLPRIRPAAGCFQPRSIMTDREYTQAIAALRICFSQVGIVLSTREPAWLRDGLMDIAVTLISAGSHTEPGGYTHVGEDKLHLTVHGKPVPTDAPSQASAAEQFMVSDDRSVHTVVNRLHQMGLDPVWKDWDSALTS